MRLLEILLPSICYQDAHPSGLLLSIDKERHLKKPKRVAIRFFKKVGCKLQRQPVRDAHLGCAGHVYLLAGWKSLLSLGGEES